MTLIAVLDVNILASAAVSEQGFPRVVVRAGLRRQYRLVVSAHIITKLKDTFEKRYFAERLGQDDQDTYIELLIRRSKREEPDTFVRGIAPDLEDDLVLGTAVAANADFLVTGDKGLLAIDEYRGVKIVTADAFLAVLELE